MKVNDRNLTGLSTPGAERTQPASEIRPGSGGARVGQTAEGDRVEFSSALSRLSSTISRFTQDRAQRVSQLAASYTAGTCRPDPRAIGRAMVSEALASSGE
jgi:hypothetical protein